jgi:hypothetical protein
MLFPTTDSGVIVSPAIEVMLRHRGRDLRHLISVYRSITGGES